MKKNRDGDSFIIEGARAVEAALSSPLVIREVLLMREPEGTEFGAVLAAARKRGIAVRHAGAKEAKKLVATKSPQGILATADIPAPISLQKLAAIAHRVLILDGINDPGNAGTLLRTAHLFGWDAVLMTPGTVSFFSEKTVRASAGAVGFVPWAEESAPEMEKALSSYAFRMVVALPEASRPANEFASAERLALVLGNESRGPASRWNGAVSVGVPMRSSPVGSLSVATSGSILLHELRPR